MHWRRKSLGEVFPLQLSRETDFRLVCPKDLEPEGVFVFVGRNSRSILPTVGSAQLGAGSAPPAFG